jgi:hypothetical protein
MVESRCDDSAIGPNGERSAYQITRDAWEETTSLPFSDASDPTTAFAVARQRLIWIKWGLLEAHIEPTPYNLALAWREGRSGVILGKWANQAVRDYGIRVENLYRDR